MYDEEGVAGQRVTLIKDGILEGYLHSRESAGYFKTKSNGHARADETLIPVSRMSNLIISSAHEVSYDELKEELVRLCKEQDKPYGLILSGAIGGMALPQNTVFDTYPKYITRVYPPHGRTGIREEMSRGAYVVGTAAQTLQNIILTSNKYNTRSSFCGAESGFVPVSQTAPDALLSSLDINRIPKKSYPHLRTRVLPDRVEE